MTDDEFMTITVYIINGGLIKFLLPGGISLTIKPDEAIRLSADLIKAANMIKAAAKP